VPFENTSAQTQTLGGKGKEGSLSPSFARQETTIRTWGVLENKEEGGSDNSLGLRITRLKKSRGLSRKVNPHPTSSSLKKEREIKKRKGGTKGWGNRDWFYFVRVKASDGSPKVQVSRVKKKKKAGK